VRRNTPNTGDHPKPGGGAPGKKPFRKFHHKRRPDGGGAA
jgi:hypothetical protein